MANAAAASRRCSQLSSRISLCLSLRTVSSRAIGSAEPISSPSAEASAAGTGLDWARRQGALSWELRCATRLAQLSHEEQRSKEAHEPLSAVYDRFTEGFETADLKPAKALIADLR